VLIYYSIYTSTTW